MIVGIGVDVVSIARLATSLRRRPALRERLFTPGELIGSDGGPRPVGSLAGRFAAKEAVAKALGGGGFLWTDVEVRLDELGRPLLDVRGKVAARAVELGVAVWHVSIAHDGGIATATVIAESA